MIKLFKKSKLQEGMEEGSNLVLPLELIKVLERLNLVGIGLGIKLMLPWNEESQRKELDEGHVCYMNIKARDNVQKKI